MLIVDEGIVRSLSAKPALPIYLLLASHHDNIPELGVQFTKTLPLRRFHASSTPFVSGQIVHALLSRGPEVSLLACKAEIHQLGAEESVTRESEPQARAETTLVQEDPHRGKMSESLKKEHSLSRADDPLASCLRFDLFRAWDGVYGLSFKNTAWNETSFFASHNKSARTSPRPEVFRSFNSNVESGPSKECKQ
jgi:hypothetical protein